MDTGDITASRLPEIELRLSTAGDEIVLDRWTIIEAGQRLVAENSGARQFNWRGAGPRRLVLPLVRLARWRSTEFETLPAELPLLEGRGRSNAAALLGDLHSSAGRVKWVAEMLSFSEPPCPREAVSRLKRWFVFENVQGKRESERVRVSANGVHLVPRCVNIILDGNVVDGAKLDQIEARLSWMVDGGSLPPWPWGDRAEMAGYVPCTATECLGRDRELAEIDLLYNDDAEVRLLVVAGKPGEGKTTVAREWVIRRCLKGGLRESVIFGWSFYRQGHGGGAQMLATFWNELSNALGVELDDGMLPIERAAALVEGIRLKSTLLFLDGVEVLIDETAPYALGLVDETLAEVLSYLLESDQGWVIVTSRKMFRECDQYGFPRVQRLQLGRWRGGDSGGAVTSTFSALEQQLFVANKGGLVNELNDIIASGERIDRDGLSKLVRGMLEHLGDSPERKIMLAMGFFDRPAEWECLLAFVTNDPPIRGLTCNFDQNNEDLWDEALRGLQSKKLIQVESNGCIWLHPQIAEIVAAEVRLSLPLTWVEGQRWLANWFSAIPAMHEPNTILEMEPLFRAMWHGCQAGDYRRAYDEIGFPRLSRGNEGYLVIGLGAYQETLDMTRLFSPDHATFPPGCDLSNEDRALTISVSALAYRWMGRLEIAYKSQKRAWEMIPRDCTLRSVGPIGVHMLRCQHIFGDLKESEPIIRRLLSVMLKAPITAGQLKVSPEMVADAIGYIAASSALLFRARGQWFKSQVFLKLARSRASKLIGKPFYVLRGFGCVFHGILLLDEGKWREVEKGIDQGDLEPVSKRFREIGGEELLRGRALSAKALEVPDHEVASISAEALRLLQRGLKKVTAKRLTWWQCNFLFAIAIHHARQSQPTRSKDVANDCLKIARAGKFRLFECDVSILIAAIDSSPVSDDIKQLMHDIGYRPKVEWLLAGIRV